MAKIHEIDGWIDRVKEEIIDPDRLKTDETYGLGNPTPSNYHQSIQMACPC